ncbi:hypothetical protein OSTOST_20500, partial [Ostertagia ostertagi]
ATDYIVSAFNKLTIGQAERFQTRLGVIRYADSVELLADLNDYTSTADLLDLDIPIMNEIGTNIEGAIHLATSKFLSPSHRAAARPVLIIVANGVKSVLVDVYFCNGIWNPSGSVATYPAASEAESNMHG